MKLFKLPCGVETMVDDEDYQWVADLKGWTLQTDGYIQLRRYPFSTTLARLVMFAKKGQQVDHIDGNRLNNQKSNLRLCTRAENLRNRRKTAKPTRSKYKGVTLSRSKRYPNLVYWVAKIGFQGQVRYLGAFKTQEEAARTYDEAATRLHGAFAHTNF